MSGFWYPPDDQAPDTQTFSGSAHSVSGEKPDDCPADRVRRVAEEVSRKSMPRPAPRRMGF